jgi:hypothetical protein
MGMADAADDARCLHEPAPQQETLFERDDHRNPVYVSHPGSSRDRWGSIMHHIIQESE